MLLETYKGLEIQDNNSVIEVYNPIADTKFIVALDDSKCGGNRREIPQANNVQTARKYIDWVKNVAK